MRRIACLVLGAALLVATVPGATYGSSPAGPDARRILAPAGIPEPAGILNPAGAPLLPAAPAGMRTVIVTMRGQADLRPVPGVGRAARQAGIIRSLQGHAATSQRQLVARLRVLGARGLVARHTDLWIINGVSVTATPAVIAELARRADVLSVTPDEVPIVPAGPAAAGTSATEAPASSAPTEPSIELGNAPAMWSLGFTGQGVVVANLDSGVDASHPDLAARWRGGSNSWFDPYGQHPSTPTDLSGHGTATMGVIVGGDAGGTSIGMAPGATWIAARIFNDSGTATATAIHSAFQWVLDPDGNPATADAPQVVNNSWAYGTPGCNLAFQPDLQALRAAEIIPVFAAGNFGPGTATSVSPANYPEALAVGATSNADVVSSMSGRGPSACGEASTIYPELVAPGVSIHSADLYGLYQTTSGTSLAAPHVAGALALLLSAHPGVTASAQASALTASTVDLGPVGPDNTYGNGRVDVLAAHDWLVANPPPAAAPTTGGVSLSPNPSDGTAAVTLSATVTSTGSTVGAAEYFVDSPGPDSTGCAIAGGYGMASVDLAAAIPVSGAVAPCADLATLGSGSHVIHVHGKDATGAWGATSAATLLLALDAAGPSVSGLSISPPAANSQAVAISAAASDTSSGNSVITAGEYFLDSEGADGSGAALAVGEAAPASTLSGAIPAAAVAALVAGSHAVAVHAKDAAGNWGARVTTTLLVDRTSPTFKGITLTPRSVPAGTVGVAVAVTGASDPLVAGLASGVAGGEWWIGTTNITAGTGTAFSGQAGTVATASLAAGTYTVRVRIRDAAGNWSTGTGGVRTTKLTVTSPPADAIFANGFESGAAPWGWSSRSTTNTARLNVTASAALVGTLGLQAQGNGANYVQQTFGTTAQPATATYDARFSFNPNSNAGTNQDILAARATGGTTLFRVRYRWNGGTPQVQIQVGTGTANAAWAGINNATNDIEVVWESGTTLQLYTNGSLAQTITAGTGSVASVRLGSVTSGGSSILEHFDGFTSKRSISPLFGTGS